MLVVGSTWLGQNPKFVQKFHLKAPLSLQYSEKEMWRNLVSLLVEFQYFQLSVPYLPPQTQPFRQRKWTQRVFQNFSIWSSNQSHSWNFIKSTQTLLNYLESFLISPEIEIWMIGEERIILGRETRESRQVCSSWAYKRQMGTLGQLRDDLRQQKTANVFREGVKIYFNSWSYLLHIWNIIIW